MRSYLLSPVRQRKYWTVMSRERILKNLPCPVVVMKDVAGLEMANTWRPDWFEYKEKIWLSR